MFIYILDVIYLLCSVHIHFKFLKIKAQLEGLRLSWWQGDA